MMKNVKAESLETVHTHTHTPYFYRIGGQPAYFNEIKNCLIEQSYKEEKSENKKYKLYSGITLIALVVTIIVLLILAGVTIMYVLGENGIFNTAKGADLQTKLGKLEERADVIYSGLLTKKYAENSSEKITTKHITDKLKEEGYEIRVVELDKNAITGIKIQEIKDDKIIMSLEERKEVEVEFIMNEEGLEYYAVIEGKNYEIKLKDGELTVNRNAKELRTEDTSKKTIEVSSDKIEGKEVTVSKNETKETRITLQAGDEKGSSKIIVAYGEHKIEFTAIVEAKPSINSTADIENVKFSTAYGRIDIIWLKGTSNEIATSPNAPVLTSNNESMVPVAWNEKNEAVELTRTTNEENEWYNYREAEGTEDSKKSNWANAKTKNSNLTSEDESYFVWIPRYAYRITYYENETSQEPTGYYDGYGMWNAKTGKVKCRLEVQKDAEGNEVKDEKGNTISLIETVEYKGNRYIVHPAFETNLDMGGWKNDLPGFWFAKFTSSGSSATTLKSTPGASMTAKQSIGTNYTNARKATYGYTGVEDEEDKSVSFMNSHMVKNSEWGAVAYLTHSKYGRNGKEISPNNSSYVTGGGTANSYATTNTAQSTTGNAYGIYDMARGIHEQTAAWDNKIDSYISSGSSFASLGGNSTKYATAYQNGTNNDSSNPITYNVSKTGDAIKEVWAGNSNMGWFSDLSLVPAAGCYSIRGGSVRDTSTSEAGIFHANYTRGGEGGIHYGFRVALCP